MLPCYYQKWMKNFVCIVAFVFCLVSYAQAADPITLTLAHSATPENSLSLSYNKFAELVKEKTGGKVIIEVHGGGVLAGDQTAIDGAKMGLIDMGSSASNNMAAYTKAFWVTDLPFIFKDIETSHKVWWGPIGEEMKAQASKEIGVKALFYLDMGGGFRVIGNNMRPVRVPKDLEGLKIRATGSPVELATLKAWGASTTPVPWPEVYTALEQKVINGGMLHPIFIYYGKHHEALEHFTRIDAISNVHVCFISNASWDKLSPDLQAAIEEAGQETQLYAAEIDAKQGKEVIAALQAAGLEYYEPTPAEVKQWRDLAVSVWPQFKEHVSQKLIDRVLKAQE